MLEGYFNYIAHEARLQYHVDDTAQEHLEKLLGLRAVGQLLPSIENMNFDGLYDGVKRALCAFGPIIKHAQYPTVTHLQNYNGDEQYHKAHRIVEGMVNWGFTESGREMGKELDEPVAAWVLRQLEDVDNIDRHLQGCAGLGYFQVIDALVQSRNILVDFHNASTKLGTFIITYAANLNKLSAHGRLHLEFLKRVAPRDEIHLEQRTLVAQQVSLQTKSSSALQVQLQEILRKGF